MHRRRSSSYVVRVGVALPSFCLFSVAKVRIDADELVVQACDGTDEVRSISLGEAFVSYLYRSSGSLKGPLYQRISNMGA